MTPSKWMISIGALVVALGLIVWPTPFAIYQMGDGGSIARVNRFTGVIEHATDRGWRTSSENMAEALDEAFQEARALVTEGKVEGYSWDFRPGLRLHLKSGETVDSVHRRDADRFVRLLQSKNIPEVSVAE